GRPLPARLGMWPAAAGLLVFTWLELAAPEPASATALLTFLAVYAAAQLAGAARHGDRWFDRGDAFEVYSTLLARLSPFGRRRDGRPGCVSEVPPAPRRPASAPTASRAWEVPPLAAPGESPSTSGPSTGPSARHAESTHRLRHQLPPSSRLRSGREVPPPRRAQGPPSGRTEGLPTRTLVLRNPLHGLDATEPAPGLVATVCVMLGSTAYDGFSDAPSWINTVQTSPLGRTPTATLGLLGAIALVAALYCLCAGAARLISGQLPHPLTAFAHSLVPIALGYLVAHYFTLLVTEGPRTVMVAFGTDNAVAPEPPLDPGGLATLQVLAIVTGHVLGVVAAHDRSVRLFPPARAVAGQLPLLGLMVAYTVGGLILLLA
ncbi:hypothetical protein P8605_27535, partial [Streptomyces sp. T-3]|nr:hypothetical protein [Streptomyces sp. T-3]